MRKSRVLLAGVAVAAAAAATSSPSRAATPCPPPARLTAGYGKVTVSGATVDRCRLQPAVLGTSRCWTTSSSRPRTDVTSTDLTATMILKNGSTVIGNYGCNKARTAPR